MDTSKSHKETRRKAPLCTGCGLRMELVFGFYECNNPDCEYDPDEVYNDFGYEDYNGKTKEAR